jgi:putative RecB family exonuclease
LPVSPESAGTVQSTFSPSSLSCFENCPKQYHFRYIEPIEIDQEGIEAFVGKRVHEVLERLYRFVAEGMVPSLARVLWRYRQNFESGFDAARVRIVREGTAPAWYRDAGERGLRNYYQRHYPFDRDETLGLERPIRFDLDPDGRYALRGIIDRLVRARDGALEIHDFKTGRRVPSQDELDRDRQLGLYELGVRELLGETGEVRLVWHYVVPDQVRVSTRSEAQRGALREATARTIDRIRTETGWAPRPSGLCDWCEFRPHCPAFAGSRPALAAEPVLPAPPVDPQLPLPVG